MVCHVETCRFEDSSRKRVTSEVTWGNVPKDHSKADPKLGFLTHTETVKRSWPRRKNFKVDCQNNRSAKHFSVQMLVFFQIGSLWQFRRTGKGAREFYFETHSDSQWFTETHWDWQRFLESLCQFDSLAVNRKLSDFSKDFTRKLLKDAEQPKEYHTLGLRKAL